MKFDPTGGKAMCEALWGSGEPSKSPLLPPRRASVGTKPPKTSEDWRKLPTLSASQLQWLGCRLYTHYEGADHWLYPEDWYADIPDHFPVFTILRTYITFKAGITPADARGGCLAYGFLKRKD